MSQKKNNLTWLKLLIIGLIVFYVYQNFDLGVQKITIKVPSRSGVIDNLTSSGASLIVPTASQNVMVSGGNGADDYLKTRTSYIDFLSVCKESSDTYDSCDRGEVHDNNNIYLYWQVINGIGCCSTFNCDYDAFYNACLKDTINLFDVYIDGDKMNWNESFYQYACSRVTPWNRFEIDNVPDGTHNIVVKQKDCERVIDERTIIVTIATQLDGSYLVTQKVE